MYPAIYVGKRFEESGNIVRTHSTIKSPISVYKDEEYPLKQRFELYSVFDKSRKTFIYNIRAYDKVLIITDSELKDKEGLLSLINAVEKQNNNISVVRWS